MIGLDTNVLARFLVEDDMEQSRIATELLEEMSARGEVGFVADIVLAELSWILDRSYNFSRGEIAASFRHLLLARQLDFRSRDEIREALDHYDDGGDLADHLIVEQSLGEGCSRLATFDKMPLRRDKCRAPQEIFEP